MSKNLKAYSNLLFACFIILLTSQLASQDLSLMQTSNEETVLNAARIGHKSGGAIKKEDLLSSAKLSLISPYDTLFQIASFRLTRVRKGQTPIELKNDNGGELTDSMKDLIKNSLQNDKFYFEYIKCKAYDGTKLTIGALSFVIE